MPYKISGNLGEDAKIIVVKETDWSVEGTSDEVAGEYEVGNLITGEKLIISRKDDGHSISYGNVTPEIYSGDRGVFGGGYDGTRLDTMEYITIGSLGDGTDFGDLNDINNGLASCSNGMYDRGIFAGGNNGSSMLSSIQYVTMSSLGDTQSFGSLTQARGSFEGTDNAASGRGIFVAGTTPVKVNTIDYITINSTGVAYDFGDLYAQIYVVGCLSNGANDRGIMAGGTTGGDSSNNVISYVTISSTSNSYDFGDLAANTAQMTTNSNTTGDRGIFAGGRQATTTVNDIDYITITSLGNVSTFGDLTTVNRYSSGVSNGTNNRGVFAGGYDTSYTNRIDYINISSLGDASNFGDLIEDKFIFAGTSNA